jgi:hypothetical protein
LLLWLLQGFWFPAEAVAAKANLKALYTAEKAYAVPGHDVQLGSFFDLSFDIDVPPPGGSATGFFDMFTEINLDGGGFVPLSGIGTLIHHDTGLDFFPGELLGMDLASPPGGPSILMRESPTLQSLGQTKLTTVGGDTHVDSFFDVFVELSLDNGETWLPATPSIPLATVPEPASAALLILGALLLSGRRWQRLIPRKPRQCSPTA